MVAVAPPATLRVAIRCTGVRKSGDSCNQLLAVIEVAHFDGVLRIKCPRCDYVQEYR